MTFLPNNDFYFEIADSQNPGFEVIRKFGRNTSIGTTAVPVTTATDAEPVAPAEPVKIIVW